MKNLFRNIFVIPAAVLAFAALTSCSDMNGDGEGTFNYEGSQNPENVSYRNPVWEPSLAGGTLFKASSTFVAISPETQWSVGIPMCCPSVYSYDAMKYQFNSQNCFTYDKTDAEGEVVTPGTRPAWSENPIVKVSADFCKTVTGANYWMFYATADGIGAASASSGQGPYTDLGKVDLPEGAANPYFLVASTNFYVCYTTPDGTFVAKMNIRRGQTPKVQGTPTKIASADLLDVCLYRQNASSFYLLGTVKNAEGRTEIRYARASSVTGPYADKAGASLADGTTNGDLLIAGSAEFENPCNPMRVLTDETGLPFVAFNATQVGNATMPSGFTRQPMFLYPITLDEDGWAAGTIAPETGWTSPRYTN